MKNTKRITALLLVFAMLAIALSGCGKDSKKDGKYQIGIIQLVQHDALDQATKGFQDEVKKELGADNVSFDVQNAGGDSATCATIANGFVTDGVDLIMANTTASLQAAMAATAEIPIVATSVTDYATALQMDNWSGKTGINITGTSDLAPIDKQAEIIKELVPNAKQVAILYCSAEPNSKFQAEEMKKNLNKLGIGHKEYTAADSNDLTPVATKAVSECDVLYLPTDNVIASSVNSINELASAKKVPVVCGEEALCKGGGLATLSINYYDLGVETGKMACQILKDGKNPGDMKVEYYKNPVKEYVPERADALGITIPEGYVILEN